MTRFVIDEVVLQNAHVGKNSSGIKDVSAPRFMLDFCNSTHKLALNTAIKIKYHKLSEKLIGQKIFLNMPSLIHQLLHDTSKLEYFDYATFEFEGPKKCDKEFVKVAKESSGILVTEDGPLIGVIEEKGLTGIINVKRINDAITFLH